MIAYKGFDKNLKCLDYQYKIGETFEIADPPKICRSGFHFCYKLGDVFNYYGRGAGNRFCKVEVLGEVIKDGDKGCTNKIKILEELDAYDELVTIKIDEFLMLQSQFPDLILGGSLALILQGVIPKRDVKDIDIVSYRYFEFRGAQVKGESISKDNDALKVTIGYNTYDYFIIPSAVYKTVEYRGRVLKVQSTAQIMEAKFKYYNKGVSKHKDDILHYLNGFSAPALAQVESSEMSYSDLPF